jgi:hypothetical protein
LAAPAALLLIAGCDRAPPAVDVVRASLGLPAGDYPNYDERVALYATNRARTDPTAEGWPTYPAQPPLLWQVDLNHSARVHSQDMHDTPCFQHNSCDGTDAFARVQTYYTGPWMEIGENISAGKSVSDGFIAIHNWIYEIGAAAGETGHRDNIFSAKFTLIGNGFVPGGTAFQNYWTQDFIGTPVTHPRLADGVHFPATIAAGAAATFGTTYYDAGGAAPTRIAVVVDGVCNLLGLVHGIAARGAYEAKLSLATGCHPYFFLSTTGGADATYPDSGALQVGIGVDASACPLAVTTRAVNGCATTVDAGAPPDAPAAGSGGRGGSGSGGSGGASGSGGARGSGGASGSGGAGDPGGSGGGTDPGSGAGSGGAGDPNGSGGASDPGSGNGGASATGGAAGEGSGGDSGNADAGVAPIPSPANRGGISGAAGCAVAPAGRVANRGGGWIALAFLLGAWTRPRRSRR